jgi:hypothetical protein
MQNQRVRNWSVRGDSRFATGLLVLALFLFALAARAEPSGAARSNTAGFAQRIEIFLVGALGRDPTLARRVTSRFHRTNFQVTASFAPKLDVDRVLEPRGNSVLQVWVVLAGETPARLYFTFTEPHERRTLYLLRDLRLEQGLDEIGAERIAEVLHLSVLALIEGQAESGREELEDTLARDASTLSERDPSPKPRSTASAVPPRPKSLPPASETTRGDMGDRLASGRRPRGGAAKTRTFHFGLGYGGSFRGDEGLWHGPRGSVHLLGSLLGAAIFVEGAIPTTHTFDTIDVRTYGASAALLVEHPHAFTPGISAEAFLGPGIDIVHYEPRPSPDSAVTVGKDATEGRPKIIAGATLILGRAAPRVSVVCAASIAFTRTHYDVVLDGQNQVVARPWVVFPMAGAELRF